MFFNESYDLNRVDVEPSNVGITADMAGGYRIMAESTEEWYTLREKMMRLEHTAVITEDAMLLEAGVGDFFRKIAEIFKKIWAKVKEMFQKLVVFIQSFVMNAKKFAQKYEKVLKNKSYSGFEYTGYTFEGLKDSDQITKGTEEVCNIAIKRASDIKAMAETAVKEEEITETDAEEYRLNIMSKIVPEISDVNEFQKEVMDTLRGSEEPETIDTVSVNEIIDNLKNGQSRINKLKSLKTRTDEMYSKAIKALEDAAKSFEKNFNKSPEATTKFNNLKITTSTDRDDLTRYKYSKTKDEFTTKSDEDRIKVKEYLNKKTEMLKMDSDIVNIAIGCIIQATKELLNQDKKVAAKMVTWKSNKNESYSFSDSLLDRF